MMRALEFNLSRRSVLIGIGATTLSSTVPAMAADDPLPAWNDTPTKQAILDFVMAADQQDGPGFVPQEERVAVFDMDGTLLPERPMAAAVFPFVAELKIAAQSDPALLGKPAIAALLNGDVDGVRAAGEQGQVDIITALTAGKSVEEAGSDLRRLTADEKNIKFNRPLRGLAYAPEHVPLQYAAQAVAHEWLESFKEFPPRAKSASFTVDQIVESLMPRN